MNTRLLLYGLVWLVDIGNVRGEMMVIENLENTKKKKLQRKGLGEHGLVRVNVSLAAHGLELDPPRSRWPAHRGWKDGAASSRPEC